MQCFKMSSSSKICIVGNLKKDKNGNDSRYCYRCACGKSYKKQRKLTKHQIKHAHGIHKKKHKSSPAKEMKKQDLLGSILTGMKSLKDEKQQNEEWEGQLTLHEDQQAYQNTSSHTIQSQKYDSKSNSSCSNSSLSSEEPLQIEASHCFGSSKRRVCNKTPQLLHLQEKERIKMRVRVTTSRVRYSTTKKENKHALFRQNSRKPEGSNTNERKNKGKSLDLNANEKLFNNNRSRKDKSQTTDSHGKNSLHMNGMKSYRSKSSWGGSQRIGSTRTDWRPDRAYDIHRNSMEVNDAAHPNDVFDLCRIKNG